MNTDLIAAQLPHVLEETNLGFLGEKYQGKVRDSYIKDGKRFLVTTDRLSCFDVVLTSVPFKGQLLNQLAVAAFKNTEDIIDNHIIDVPDPNVMLSHNLEILPIEVIVRAYITGSAWRDYEAGKAISGITLPEGLRASQKFDEPIITPSTKADVGEHDMPISEEEILSSGLVEKSLWEQIREVSLAVFERGQAEAAKRGLILVDTKYEFGLLNGKLHLADEIHTLDSSRFWISSDYEESFAAGKTPKQLDKEPIRQWLIGEGYMGEGEPPVFTDDHRISIAKHYVDTYEKLSGKTFVPEVGDVHERLVSNLKRYAE